MILFPVSKEADRNVWDGVRNPSGLLSLSALTADFFLSPQPALLLSEEEEHLLLVLVHQCLFLHLLYFDDWWMGAAYQFPASLQGK